MPNKDHIDAFNQLLKNIENGVFLNDVLKFENAGLDDDDFNLLLAAIKKNDNLSNNLRAIELASNKIIRIQDCVFSGLRKLQSIDLYDNKITSINKYTFFGSDELKSLDLGCNKISCINPDTFFGLNNLIDLKLYQNSITMINDGAFCRLRNLESLDLDCNQITRIHDGAFVGLSNLKSLNLYKNKIMSINKDTFASLNKLEILNLTSNENISINTCIFSDLKCIIEIDIDLLDDMSLYILSKLPESQLSSASLIDKSKYASEIETGKKDFFQAKLHEIKNGYIKTIINLQTILRQRYVKILPSAIITKIMQYAITSLKETYDFMGEIDWYSQTKRTWDILEKEMLLKLEQNHNKALNNVLCRLQKLYNIRKEDEYIDRVIAINLNRILLQKREQYVPSEILIEMVKSILSLFKGKLGFISPSKTKEFEYAILLRLKQDISLNITLNKMQYEYDEYIEQNEEFYESFKSQIVGSNNPLVSLWNKTLQTELKKQHDLKIKEHELKEHECKDVKEKEKKQPEKILLIKDKELGNRGFKLERY